MGASDLIDNLQQDLLWLLILVYSRRQRILLPRIKEMSREDFAVEMVLLESATRDIVSRLIALDDDGRGVRSFQSALKALRQEGAAIPKDAPLAQQVKAYRKIVNVLKVEHRNSYIAHVTEGVSVTPRILDESVDIATATSAAVNLLDMLAGKVVSYTFRVGSQEKEIDLRSALSAPARNLGAPD